MIPLLLQAAKELKAARETDAIRIEELKAGLTLTLTELQP